MLSFTRMNAVILRDANGNNKMRLLSMLFVEPVPIEMEESEKQEQPAQAAKTEQCSQPRSTAKHPSAETQEALPETSSDNSGTSRPIRLHG